VNADWVELTFSATRGLHVTAAQGDEIIAERTYTEGDSTLSCGTDGAEILAYSGLPQGKGANAIAGLVWEATYLRKAQDGALILKHHAGVVGMIYMIVPVAGADDSWVRFPEKK
jgi:hypothetical protein